LLFIEVTETKNYELHECMVLFENTLAEIRNMETEDTDSLMSDEKQAIVGWWRGNVAPAAQSDHPDRAVPCAFLLFASLIDFDENLKGISFAGVLKGMMNETACAEQLTRDMIVAIYLVFGSVLNTPVRISD